MKRSDIFLKWSDIFYEIPCMYLKQKEENVNAIQFIRDEMIKQNKKITKDIEDNKSLNLTAFDQHLQQINKLNNEFDEFKNFQNKLIFDQNKSISQLKTFQDKIESNVDELSKQFNAHSSNADQKLTLFSNEIKELSKLQNENKDDISALGNQQIYIILVSKPYKCLTTIIQVSLFQSLFIKLYIVSSVFYFLNTFNNDRLKEKI